MPLAESYRPPRRDLLVAVAVGISAALIVYFRLPPIVRGTVWAEDGALLLTQRLSDGAWTDFFKPHGGYLQGLPRLATEAIVAFVPLEKFGVAAAASAALILALLAMTVFIVSGSLIRWVPARILLALVPVFAPVGTTEVLGNLANVHWAFLAMMPILLLGRLSSWRGTSLLAVVVLLAVLTEPQVVIFAPLLLVGWRDKKRIPVALAFGVGVAIQVGAYLSHARDASQILIDPPSLFQGFLVQSGLGSFFGSADVLSSTVQDSGLILPSLCVFLFLLSFGYILFRGSAMVKIAAIALLAGAVVAWMSAVIVNGMSNMEYFSFGAEPFPGLAILRYGYAPSVMLLTLPILAAAIAHQRGRVSAAWGILLILTLVFIVNFRTSSTARDHGPAWIDGYRSAVTECVTTEAESVRIVTAPIDWAATVPCSSLLPVG